MSQDNKINLEEQIGEVDHGMPDRMYVLFKGDPGRHKEFIAEKDLPRCHGFIEYIKRSTVEDILAGKRGLEKAKRPANWSWK